jgi:hypothetical protein
MGYEEEKQLTNKLNEVTDRWRHTRTVDDAKEVADTLYSLIEAISQRDKCLAHNLAWCVRIGMELPSQGLYNRLNDLMITQSK